MDGGCGSRVTTNSCCFLQPGVERVKQDAGGVQQSVVARMLHPQPANHRLQPRRFGARRATDVECMDGIADKAQRYIRWFEKELRHAETEGIVVDHALRAMYEAYKGREDVAFRELVAAVPQDVWLEAPHMALLKDFTDAPEYLAAVEVRQAEIARQSARVLEMLCGPEPVSRKYKPLPETCAQWKPSK